MDDVYYSTGQAAHELGVSQAKIRMLCETGAIDSTSTTGGQYRISRDNVERLKSEGLPSIPRPLPEPDRPSTGSASRSRHNGVALLAEPSGTVINSAEEVAVLEHEVRAIGLRREKEEALDWFRERGEREAARKAEQEEAERERQAQAQADRQRQLWQERWIEYGLDSLRWDVPQAYRLDVHRAVEEVLAGLNPTQADWTTRQLVDAAVDRALAPWYRAKQMAEAVRKSAGAFSVPLAMKLDQAWKARMHEAAATRVAGLRDGATEAEIETAANQAIVPLVREFEHERACKEVVNGVGRELAGANHVELEQGKELVLMALAELPIGAARSELEGACATELLPIRASMAARWDREVRAGVLQYVGFSLINWPDDLGKQALAAIHEALDRLPPNTPRSDLEKVRDQVIEHFRGVHQKNERKARLIESGLLQIFPYLEKLKEDWEFDGKSTFQLAQELVRPIREFLEQELVGTETEDRVASLTRLGVRRKLGIKRG